MKADVVTPERAHRTDGAADDLSVDQSIATATPYACVCRRSRMFNTENWRKHE